MSKDVKHKRLAAFAAAFTGQLPTIEKQIVKVISSKRQSRKNTETKEKRKGVLANPRTRWQDRVEHPSNMGDLDDLNRDPDVESAITTLTEMVATSFFTEMDKEAELPVGTDGKRKEHPNKIKFDKWCEKHRGDEVIKMAVRESFEKGFFVIDLDPDDDFEPTVLPSESIWFWRKPNEKKPYKVTQEFGGGVVETWEGDAQIARLIIWAHKETPMNPYGKALAFCLQESIDARREMTEDGNAVLHRLGYPDRRFECGTEELRDQLVKEYQNKEPQEALFLAGVDEGDIREVVTQPTNIRINFEGFQDVNDKRITNNLNAPTMSTLRNATEASATKMLEFYENYAQGIQQSLKRLLENSLVVKVIGTPSESNPMPNIIFGRQKTGLEKLSADGIASLKTSGCITFEQAQDLLKKLGVPLQDLPEQPLQQNPAGISPADVGLPDLPQLNPDRMKTLQRSLDVVDQNYRAHNISLSDAYQEGAKIIRVHVEAARRQVVERMQNDVKDAKLSPEAENYFRLLTFSLGSAFKERLLPTGSHKHKVESVDGKQYSVTVSLAD